MSVLKVTIKDSTALAAVTRQSLEEYLRRAGWHKRADHVKVMANGERMKFGEIWSWDTSPIAQSALIVPSSEKVSDYIARIAEALFMLEVKEGRSQLEIYVDITQTPISVKPVKNKAIKEKKDTK